MKKLIILTTAILMTFGLAKAQNIDISRVAIMPINDNTQGVYVGDNIGQAISILGSPSSITDKYFEMDDVTAKVYSYGNNKLYFVDGKLNSYNLTDGSLQAGTINGTAMKVGDEIKVLTRTITRPVGQHGTTTETITTRTFFDFTIKQETGKVNGLSYSYRVTCPVLRNGIATDMNYGLLFGSDNKLRSITLTD